MRTLRPEDRNLIIALYKKYLPLFWLNRNILSSDDYINEFIRLSKNVEESEFEYFAQWYFESIGDILGSFYANANALMLEVYAGPKTFAGLEKQWLENSYRNYLKKNCYSELIEYTTLLGFIGHETEVFTIEMKQKNYKAGFLTRLLSPKLAHQIDNIPIQIDSLNRLYEHVLSPEPTISQLRTLLQAAQTDKCYINPCVFTIVERAEEAGIKRFRQVK